MPFDGNGNWVADFSAKADRDANIKIMASRFDDIHQADLKESFENCLTKDGQIKPLQNFNANNFRVINVANPVQDNDAVNKQTLDSTVSTLLASLYPVGSLYIGTQATCPLSSLIYGSTWELIGTKILTDIPATLQAKGNGNALGVTNGAVFGGLSSFDSGSGHGYTNAITADTYTLTTYPSGGYVAGRYGVVQDETKSGIIADTNASSLTVNMWKRTA